MKFQLKNYYEIDYNINESENIIINFIIEQMKILKF